jgi:shikimate dehydrogenase
MKYGLVGEKLGHSYSKVIHGFLGNHEYELVEVPRDEVENFFGKAGFKGVNITIPYKEKVMSWCMPDETAKKIGCVNTIINKNGTLYGFNTDYFGFSYMCKSSGIDFSGKKVIILGSGGTSKTASCAAGDSGASEIVIVSREGPHNYGNISDNADADILINTTPVGMYPDNFNTPVDLSVFTKLYAVIDVVYNPIRTKLILEAEQRGLVTARGLPMLVAQAYLAHELFFEGTHVPLCPGDSVDGSPGGSGGAAGGGCAEVIGKILAKTENHFSNIVLVGMPGCGKTTVGKKLADSMGRIFIDTDEAVENVLGKKIPDIIQDEGEVFFRKMESDVVSKASAASSVVISTGGGAVLDKKNRDVLKQNGIVIFLERDIKELPTKGRPLSVDLEALFKERLPIYEEMCDYEIAVTGDPDITVQKIREALK